jgi:hypothetical protein
MIEVKQEVLDYLDSLGVPYYLAIQPEGMHIDYFGENQTTSQNLALLTESLVAEAHSVLEDPTEEEVENTTIH